MAIYQNARVYWEMFDGVNDEGIGNLWVRAVDMVFDIGGWAALEHGDYFQVSVYGRRFIDSPNLVTMHQDPVSRPAGTSKWKRVTLRHTNADTDVRCIVVKVELIVASPTPPDKSGETFTYDDQYDTADAPPWGLRIHSAAIYGSQVGRNVRPDLIFTDILDNPGFTYSGPTGTWRAEQLAFTDLPKDRQEGLDEVNAMLGWNYGCWDGSEVEFTLPASGTARTIDAADPRTTWSVTESLDETYNACRVQYTNKNGKAREVIVHHHTDALSFTRADTLQAPESIKSEKTAVRFGERYLQAHAKRQVAGSLSITGDDGVLDPLLIRPGDTVTMTGPAKFLTGTHEVTSVTLRPLDWTADVQFGTNSKRFDLWLARLAVGAKSIKRR